MNISVKKTLVMSVAFLVMSVFVAGTVHARNKAFLRELVDLDWTHRAHASSLTPVVIFIHGMVDDAATWGKKDRKAKTWTGKMVIY